MAKQEKLTEDVVIEFGEGECQDGCGAKAKKRFNPGHDAKFHSLLIRAFRSGVKVTINGKTSSALAALKKAGYKEPAPIKAKAPMSDEAKAKLREARAASRKAKSTKVEDIETEVEAEDETEAEVA